MGDGTEHAAGEEDKGVPFTIDSPEGSLKYRELNSTGEESAMPYLTRSVARATWSEVLTSTDAGVRVSASGTG
jgi:hypothetical protein